MYLTWTFKNARLDEPKLFLLNGFFRWPDLEPLNPSFDRHVIDIIIVASTLMSVASVLAVAISGFRSARFACIVIVAG